MRRTLLVLFLLIQSTTQARTFEEYLTTFRAFVWSPTQNPYMPEKAVERTAAVFWGVSKGNWAMARRLAAKGGAESHYRLLPWLPDGYPEKGCPRTDPIGCHYNFLAREAYNLGIISSWKDWFTSDESTHLKEMLIEDPSLGAWLGARGYRRICRRTHGNLDKAEQIWAENPGYLKSVLLEEKEFDRMDPSLVQDHKRDRVKLAPRRTR